MNRRELGLGLLALGASAFTAFRGRDVAKSWASGGKAPQTGASAKKPPRYCVIVFLRGGMDAVYTTDPKSPSEVDSSVDVPFDTSEVLAVGNVKLGPHLEALAPWVGKMAIVNGVQVGTANHETGAEQMLRLRTKVTAEMPSILDIVGARRDGQALGCMSLGQTYRHDHSGGWFGNDALLHEMDSARPEDLAMMARTYRSHAERELRGTRDPEQVQAAESLTECAALFERLVTTPKFPFPTPQAPAQGESSRADEGMSRQLERCLWALENDLTRCAYVKFKDWDTHSFNAGGQTAMSTRFFPLFAQFLKGLETRKNAFGSLAENTVIIVGSEIGRFPRLNNDGGKDHFPQAPYLFFGPGINTHDGKGASFVDTGRMMEGRPVDLRTGRQVSQGGHLVSLNDIGATVLHTMGVSPTTHGYDGKVLDFLVTT